MGCTVHLVFLYMVQTFMYKETERDLWSNPISGAERNHVTYLDYINKIQSGISLDILFH